MRKLGLALSVAMLAAGTVAHAQVAGGISNIVGSASTTVSLPGQDNQNFGPGAGTATGNSNLAPSGASFNSFVNVGATAITFESSNTGAIANTSSTSSVSFNLTNNTGQPATFASTITAAGFGFYIADTSGGCLYTGCAQATGHTFSEFGGQSEVGFNFSITGTSINPTTGLPTTVSLYTLDGSMLLNGDGLQQSLGNSADGPNSPATGARSLAHFGEATGNDFLGDAGSASGVTYVWDATDISFGIGAIQNQTLTYSTTVFSSSSSSCLANDPTICLIAYSGFGDPVGRGGGVENLTAGGGFRNLDTSARVGGLDIFDNGLIGGIHFGPSVFDLPTFNNGEVTFAQGNGVPEPTTWMTLILGFGLLGATLRRRRTVAAI